MTGTITVHDSVRRAPCRRRRCGLHLLSQSGQPVDATGLRFGADPPPGITGIVGVDPSSDLRHLDVVRVELRPSSSSYNVFQCAADDPGWNTSCVDLTGVVEVEHQGDTVDVRVRRVLPDGTDCAASAGRCVLRLNGYRRGQAALGFDSSEAPPPEPTITAAPLTDLFDGSAVQVRSTNLRDAVYLRQCVASSVPFGDSSCQWLETHPVVWGTFDPVDQRLLVYVVRSLAVSGQTVDCAAVANSCVILATTDAWRRRDVLPLAFAG